jgi:CheY-like chemotaxis protein
VRVLLAEDNADAAEVLRMLLEGFGYRVTVAATGPAAVDAARTERPDALLCDIGLPGMSGYEVARTLRADPTFANMLMIAITGYGAPEDRQEASAAGFDLHFAKPMDPMLLLGELRKLEHGRGPANDAVMRPGQEAL